jgi:SAM-dependent methyltransferase
MDLLDHNRTAWNKLVEERNQWTIPVEKNLIEEARTGRFSILLTPTIPVPDDWIPQIRGKNILCLASGGGQQGPILSAAGAIVTVFDNSQAQLEQDRFVANRDNLAITTIQGDMRDLSLFEDESFDLIFHPVSNCFIDDVNKVWQECYRVLKKGGVLLSGLCNPLTYIFDFEEWDNHNKLLVRYKIPYSDLEQLPPDQLKAKIAKKDTVEFGHTLDDLIGGQIKAGFVISGFYEDTAGGDLLDPYIKTFIATRSIKPF